MQQLTPEIIKQIVQEAIQEALSSLSSEWPRWLPSKEASRYSGLSEKTLRRLAQEGEIYATSVGGGKLLFDRYSIDEFLLKQQKEVRLKAENITREILSR
ncbi:MAG: helix-turn-helix domain-containing protein [Thermodesulfobacterium sp.]|nr:helix-turn-helix domain-containing protein [Thermodesulfobacterium sp.]